MAKSIALDITNLNSKVELDAKLRIFSDTLDDVSITRLDVRIKNDQFGVVFASSTDSSKWIGVNKSQLVEALKELVSDIEQM